MGFGLLNQKHNALAIATNKNCSNVQTAVSTPREKEMVKQKPPTGKRIVKNYSVSSSSSPYKKERVAARESAHMSFGMR